VARYPLGQPIRVSTTVRDVTGALTDAGALTLLVKLAAADGTWTTTGTYASPAHDGLGLYHQDIPVTDLATIGHYQYTWTSTGTGAGAVPGEFDIYDPYETAVLSLQDAKDALNIPQATTSSDNEIAAYVSTIESSLRGMTGGPMVNRPITERAEFTPDLMMLQLQQRPIVSVTSIVSIPNGATVDISAGLDIDNLANAVYTKGGWAFSAFSPLATVTYVAGWGTAVPPAFNVAARIILQYLWTTQHGPSQRPSMGGMDLATVPGFPYAIPSGAADLLRGSLNGLPFLCEVFACPSRPGSRRSSTTWWPCSPAPPPWVPRHRRSRSTTGHPPPPSTPR
jgi:hypothetical protein